MVKHDRYASIKNVFKRDHDTHRIIPGEFSVPEFEYLQACEWTFTEKVDGMNVRVILDTGVDFRGRSDVVHIPRPLMKHLRATFDIESVRDESQVYGEGLCLYGVAGKYQFFTLFDVMTDYGWASRRDVVDIAIHLNIPVVSVVFEGTLMEAVELVRAGFKSAYGNFFAEGLIGRPRLELRNRYGSRIMCKIEHKDFYLGG